MQPLLGQFELVTKQKPQHADSLWVNSNWLPNKINNMQPPSESILTGCQTKHTTCNQHVSQFKLVAKQKPQNTTSLYSEFELVARKNPQHAVSRWVSLNWLPRKNHKTQPSCVSVWTGCKAKTTTWSLLLNQSELVAKQKPQQADSLEVKLN